MARKSSISTHVLLAALCGLLLILTFHSRALGQGSTPQRGFQPGGSYALSDIETINTTNGNLSLHLALGKLPAGRGGFAGQLNLHYDSKLYDSKTQYYQDWDHIVFGQPHVAIRNMLVSSEQGGWHYGTGYELQLIDRMSQYPPEIAPQYPDTQTIRHYKVKVAFPDGSLHEFLPRGFGSPMEEGYYDIRPDGWQTRFTGGYVQDVPYLTNTLTCGTCVSRRAQMSTAPGIGALCNSFMSRLIRMARVGQTTTGMCSRQTTMCRWTNHPAHGPFMTSFILTIR